MARGDHIKVRRWGGLYSHHGIDMGDGTVIHLDGEPLRARHSRVCRTAMAVFLAGGRARIVAYPRGARSGEAAAEAAASHLSRSGYCLWRNNCEHFATFCKTGKPVSRQVLRAMRLGGMAAGATFAALAAVVAARYGERGLSRRS